MKNSITNWPDKYKPEQSPVYSYNELKIDAAVEVVWAWLVRAPLWPKWYVNSKNVVIESENSLDLKLGTMFSWTTFGIRVRTSIVEFEPSLRAQSRPLMAELSEHRTKILPKNKQIIVEK